MENHHVVYLYLYAKLWLGGGKREEGTTETSMDSRAKVRDRT